MSHTHTPVTTKKVLKLKGDKVHQAITNCGTCFTQLSVRLTDIKPHHPLMGWRH